MKTKIIWGGAILALLCLTLPASAVLEVTFSEAVAINRIQYYWAGDNTSAVNATRTINPDANTILDVSVADRQAKATSAAEKYVFGASDSYPGSTAIYIRVWESAANTAGSAYSALAGAYSNPAGTGKFETMPVTYTYIKAAPSTAALTGYTESGTKSVPWPSGSPNLSQTVTLGSASGPVSGKSVEIAGSNWEIAQGGNTSTQQVGGTSLVLNLGPTPGLGAITLNPGDSITLRVKHVNIWGDESASWSNPETYTVGATGTLTETELSYAFEIHTTGINTLSIPFSSGIKDIGGTARDISTVGKLIAEINRQAKAGGSTINVSSVFGWYDKATQTHKGLTQIVYSGDNIDEGQSKATGGTVAEILAAPILKDQPYQVSVSENMSFRLKGIRL